MRQQILEHESLAHLIHIFKFYIINQDGAILILDFQTDSNVPRNVTTDKQSVAQVTPRHRGSHTAGTGLKAKF